MTSRGKVFEKVVETKKEKFFFKKTCENKNNTYLCAPKTNESWEVEIRKGQENREGERVFENKKSGQQKVLTP